jgi:hypothetical protein
MKGNLAAVIVGAICSRCRLMRGPRSKSAATRRRYELRTQTPSLDGRITGRTRTCWFETLQYDGLGAFLWTLLSLTRGGRTKKRPTADAGRTADHLLGLARRAELMLARI